MRKWTNLMPVASMAEAIIHVDTFKASEIQSAGMTMRVSEQADGKGAAEESGDARSNG